MHARQRAIAILLALLAALIGLITFALLACKGGTQLYGFFLLVGWIAIALAILATQWLPKPASQTANQEDPGGSLAAVLTSHASWLLLIAGLMIFAAAIATILVVGKISRSADVAARPSAQAAWPKLHQPIVWAQVQSAANVPGRRLTARAIVDAAKGCPIATIIDGTQTRAAPMTPRGWVPDASFPIKVCEIEAAGDQSVRIGEVQLDPPPSNPKRIVVLGDTGCRLAHYNPAQECNVPEKWPLQSIATAIKRARPDLIIHVGDYLYREKPCNGRAGCAGSPYGDTWAVWNADFFRPVAALLPAAPWIMVRGNHEDCARAGTGWDHLLSVRPSAQIKPPCNDEKPYVLTFDNLTMVVFDASNAGDSYKPDERAKKFAGWLDDLKTQLAGRAGDKWLLVHQPFWAGFPKNCDVSKMSCDDKAGADPNKKEDPIGRMRKWIEDEKELKYSLVLSGHVHNSQLFVPRNSASGLPLQLISGAGGTARDLWTKAADMRRKKISARLQATAGALWVDDEFGFALLTRNDDGWTVGYFDVRGNERMNCKLAKNKTECVAN